MKNYIHSKATISLKTYIEEDVYIGPYTIIHDNVIIERGTKIEGFCEIGIPTGDKEEELYIGPNSIIRSHSVIYNNSYFESQLETGHHVLIRSGTIAGDNLRIGSFSDIEGNCEIGNYCRFHSYVHVGQRSKVGNFVWLFSETVLANDPLPPSTIESPVTISDGVVVCLKGTILPGVKLNYGCFVCAGTVVRDKDYPIGAIIEGYNSEIVGHISNLVYMNDPKIVHPWMNHFDRGYPKEAKRGLSKLQDIILDSKQNFHISI